MRPVVPFADAVIGFVLIFIVGLVAGFFGGWAAHDVSHNCPDPSIQLPTEINVGR